MEIYLNDNRELKEKILDDIRNASDICCYIDEAIEELKDFVKQYNFSKKILGVDVPINKSFCLDVDKSNSLIGNFCWYDFIDSEVKIIYGFSFDDNSDACNDGLYYYIDDNNYLYDFSKFIKEKDIDSDFDFVSYVKEFLDGYFRSISSISLLSREERNRALINGNGKNIEPICRSNRDFYHSNIAMCTEYSSMGLNILGLFGYSCLALMGSFDYNDEEIGHAFNIIAMDNGIYLVDMAACVPVIDLDGNLIDEVPFYQKLDDEELSTFLDKEESISFNNYFYVCFGENNYKFTEDLERTYRISNIVLLDSFEKKINGRY